MIRAIRPQAAAENQWAKEEAASQNLSGLWSRERITTKACLSRRETNSGEP